MTALATIIFTTALCFTLWAGFVTLNSRWDVILDLLAGRPDPRFVNHAVSLRDRAAGLRPRPAAPFSQSSIPNRGARP